VAAEKRENIMVASLNIVVTTGKELVTVGKRGKSFQ
jgi:hypothetical protein